MEFVMCMRPISEENTINNVTHVVQNDIEASCDLWFAFLTRIFIGNLQKIVHFKDQCPYFFLGEKNVNAVLTLSWLFKSDRSP